MSIELHDFADKTYWRKRWSTCFPATYPPELYGMRMVTYSEGWWIWKREITMHQSCCKRCGERLYTFHQCADLWRD